MSLTRSCLQEAQARLQVGRGEGNAFAEHLLGALLDTAATRSATIASCLDFLDDHDAAECLSECVPRQPRVCPLAH